MERRPPQRGTYTKRTAMEALKTIQNEKLLQPVHGRRIIITGGTTGIGRAAALLLARDNEVLIAGRHDETLADTIADFERAGRGSTGQLRGTVADIATEAGIAKLFEEADKHWNQLDILINNAGLPFDSILDGQYSDWEYLLRTNLLGVLACSRMAVDRMRTVGTGHIVNIGSMSADVREKDSSVYVASKSGIQGFSESLRKEVNGLGIKVTLIEPGTVGTDMQPRSGQQEKIDTLEMLRAEDIAVAIYYCLATPPRCDVVGMQIRPHAQYI